MLNLILVRHVVTIANEEGLFLGQMNSSLSEIGKEQTKKLIHVLKDEKIMKIYTSEFSRTYETIKPLEQLAPIIKVSALNEIHFGDFEGKDFTWVNENKPEAIEQMTREKEAYCYPKGESLIQLHERVSCWLKDLLKEHKEGTILICGHGGSLRSLISELLVHNISLHWQFKIDHASITRIGIYEGFPVIESLNDKSHLKRSSP